MCTYRFCRGINDDDGDELFCGMADQRKTFRFSPSRISDMLQTGCEPAYNLSSGFVEWSCAAVITTTP